MASSILRSPNSKRLLSLFTPLHSCRGAATSISTWSHYPICANTKHSEIRPTKSSMPTFAPKPLSTLAANSGRGTEEEKKKNETAREVDIEAIRKFFGRFTRHPLARHHLGIVYYGATIVSHLNEDVALKDAVRQALIHECAGCQKLVQLGKEPTSDWIIKDRVQSDERNWDVVVSVNINKVIEEEMQKISEQGVENVIWFVIRKGDDQTAQMFLLGNEFVCLVYPRSHFFKKSPV